MRTKLAILLPGLVAACYGGDSCPEPPDTHVVDTGLRVTRSAEEVAAALDAFGELTPEGCETLCDARGVIEVYSCELLGEPDPDATQESVACSVRGRREVQCKGRLHASVRRRRLAAFEDPVTAWLKQAAWEEAASVGAFRRLARELAAHDAPTALIDRAVDAARDEIAHARAMRRLVGGSVPPVRFRRPRPRSLRALAVENAVQGCVSETFAALVAHHQARQAAAPLRPIFARIASDETRHAQWSWDLDAWARTRLGRSDVARLERARARAFAGLLAGLSEPHPAVQQTLGVPGAARGHWLARRLATALGATPRARPSRGC